MPLTDTEVRKAKPQEKPYRLSDSGSLYLSITPSGGKLWRWAYEFEGRERLMALAKHPDISLAEARGRRDGARKLQANGIDVFVLSRWHRHECIIANELIDRQFCPRFQQDRLRISTSNGLE